MNRNWTVVAVVAFASAGQALAQDSDEQQGAYIGGGIGDFSTEIDSVNFDESDTAYKLFGGWRFNQFFAVQVDYLDLGSMDGVVGAQTLSVDTDGYAARLEGTLPISFVELFATAGMVFSSVDGDLGSTQLFDESDSDPVYSVGVGFEVAERLILRLEYEIIDIESFDDAEAYWLTVAWRL
jgi:OOP family OmpA-OmpF porin